MGKEYGNYRAETEHKKVRAGDRFGKGIAEKKKCGTAVGNGR